MRCYLKTKSPDETIKRWDWHIVQNATGVVLYKTTFMCLNGKRNILLYNLSTAEGFCETSQIWGGTRANIHVKSNILAIYLIVLCIARKILFASWKSSMLLKWAKRSTKCPTANVEVPGFSSTCRHCSQSAACMYFFYVNNCKTKDQTLSNQAKQFLMLWL